MRIYEDICPECGGGASREFPCRRCGTRGSVPECELERDDED